MAETPARKYGKVDAENRASSPQDLTEFMEHMRVYDQENTLWAYIQSRDPDQFDKYKVIIYSDEFHSISMGNDFDAYSINMHRFFVGEYVRVYYKPSMDFALIIQHSMFGWLYVSKDWEPNASYLEGYRASSTGLIIEEERGNTIRVAMTANTAYAVPYAPYKAGDIIAYLRWPFETTSSFGPSGGTYDGMLLGFPQMPLPTELHQVLMCTAKAAGGGFRIGWNYVRTVGNWLGHR